jgi:hypothetical protein
MEVGGSGIDLVGLYTLGLIINLAAVLWAAGVALRCGRCRRAGHADAGLPVLFFAPSTCRSPCLQGWIHDVARVNPITRVLEAGRGFLAGTPTEVGLAFGVAVALVLFFSLWALRGLRSAEQRGSSGSSRASGDRIDLPGEAVSRASETAGRQALPTKRSPVLSLDLIARLVVAVALLWAGVSKAASRDPSLLAPYGVPRAWRGAALATLAGAELATGVLLLAGVPGAGIAAFALGCLFVGALASVRARGISRLRCSCFGRRSAARTSSSRARPPSRAWPRSAPS